LGVAAVTDYGNALIRCARNHGWTERPSNTLDYYTHRFTRPEADGRESVVRVRVTNKIVDAMIEIGGLRQSFTLPTLSRLESVFASAPPTPVLRTGADDDESLALLDQAVRLWRAKPPSDLSDAIRCGDLLATAADEAVRKIKADKEIR
jgi:hypothetical protein